MYIRLTRDEAIASISHALSQFSICPSVSDDGLETDDSVFIGVGLVSFTGCVAAHSGLAATSKLRCKSLDYFIESGVVAPSSNGRTLDFDSSNCGSSPRGASKIIRV